MSHPRRPHRPRPPPAYVALALALALLCGAALAAPGFADRLAVFAQDAPAAPPLTLELALSVAGELPVAELELAGDVSLAELVRALAALTSAPPPPGSRLPVVPVADTAVLSTARTLAIDAFTDMEAAPGHVLRILTVELENRGDRTHALPHARARDPMAAFDRDDDRLLLRAEGRDAQGHIHPAAAVLCGGHARLVPGGVLPCQFVWQLPAGRELAAVELVLPARLQLIAGGGQ